MSRALPDEDRRDIRVTIKISPNEERLWEQGGYTKKNRVQKVRDKINKECKGKK